MFRYVIFQLIPDVDPTNFEGVCYSLMARERHLTSVEPPHNQLITCASFLQCRIDANYTGPRRWDFNKFLYLFCQLRHQPRFILYDFPLGAGGNLSGQGTWLILIFYAPETNISATAFYGQYFRAMTEAFNVPLLYIKRLADLDEVLIRRRLISTLRLSRMLST